MASLKIAAVQMTCGPERVTNLERAVTMVREAASRGARLVLLQELFETHYFCQTENPDRFAWATSLENNPAVKCFTRIARELALVLPISFFERHHQAFYNTVAVIDADGTILGCYRKSHIPDGPGYEEKFYFTPGDTGFRVWPTRYVNIGVGICWDQWFPEAARAMVLGGADLLLYPTAIGSEPHHPEVDTQAHWQLCMQGHAAANIVPVVAANRVGTETVDDSIITFYGSSFITDHLGQLVTAADRVAEQILYAEIDPAVIAAHRHAWGVFRDRRPGLYKVLLTKDGKRLPDGRYLEVDTI